MHKFKTIDDKIVFKIITRGGQPPHNFKSQSKKQIMKNSTLRELMFQISEINETRNPFEIAKNMMTALENNEINSIQFELLSGSLFLECQRNKIPTSNEICSLF